MNGTIAGTPLTIAVTAQSTGGNAGGNTAGNTGGNIGGNTGGGIACSGFNGTRVVVVDWNNPGRVLTSAAGGFGANDAVVVQFTTGGNNSPANNLPKLVMAEYVSAPSGRVATLSATPCDFGVGLAPGAIVTGATTITIPFSVGPNNTGYYASLLPNTTYYLNVKNSAGSTCSTGGSCDMYVDLLKPGSGY